MNEDETEKLARLLERLLINDEQIDQRIAALETICVYLLQANCMLKDEPLAQASRIEEDLYRISRNNSEKLQHSQQIVHLSSRKTIESLKDLIHRVADSIVQ